jgi:hypothetical protein
MPTSTRWRFEIHSLILALHYEARFLKNPGSIGACHFDRHCDATSLPRYGAPDEQASSAPR